MAFEHGSDDWPWARGEKHRPQSTAANDSKTAAKAE